MMEEDGMHAGYIQTKSHLQQNCKNNRYTLVVNGISKIECTRYSNLRWTSMDE